MKSIIAFLGFIFILQSNSLAETKSLIFENENKLLLYLNETKEQEKPKNNNLEGKDLQSNKEREKDNKVLENNKSNISKKLPSPEDLDNKFSFSLPDNRPQIKVALLLPVSGKYKYMSKEIINAIELSLFLLKGDNIKILLFDTKGTLFGAYEAVHQAIDKEVKIIIGPLFSETTKVVASVAKKHDINVLSLSNDEKLVNKGAFIFGYNPRQQVIQAIEFSIANAITDFVILTPNNKYGAASARNLRLTIKENKEASLLKTEIYQKYDSKNLMKLASHVYSAYRSALKSRSDKDYDYEVDMWNDNSINYPRGMMIMSNIDDIISILKILKKYKISHKEIQLIGNSAWYDNRILEYPEVVEGAWFFTYNIKNEKVKLFEELYSDHFNESPTSISVLVYDLLALILNITRASGESDFTAQDIMKERGFRGIDGIFRFHKNGLVERSLSVVQIKNGKFVLIDYPINNFFEVKQIPVLYKDDNGTAPVLGLDGLEVENSSASDELKNNDDVFIKNIEESIFD